MFQDPQLAFRRMEVEVDGPQGQRSFIRQPILFDGAHGAFAGGVPTLGQHNADLLERRPAEVTSG